MKYNDTYSMIGAMINLGFEVEFKKEREKKEKRTQIFTEIDRHDISIKEKFGKNAILKGIDLQAGATTMERNRQIGGHKSGT